MQVPKTQEVICIAPQHHELIIPRTSLVIGIIALLLIGIAIGSILESMANYSKYLDR